MSVSLNHTPIHPPCNRRWLETIRYKIKPKDAGWQNLTRIADFLRIKDLVTLQTCQVGR